LASMNYKQDTGKFWQERRQARTALDRKRASAPASEKAMIEEQLRKDREWLRKARIISNP
jgi:hypothetical protein